MEVTLKILVGKKTTSSMTVSIHESVEDFKRKIISNCCLSVSANRVGVSLENGEKKIFMGIDNKKLTDYGVVQGSIIIVKDLGPQISWRLVYVIEYLGPLLIAFLFFVKNNHFNNASVTNVAFIMFSFHYLKRILETIFVHEFSKSTMPLFNLVKNSSYYWILSGLLIGHYVFNGGANYQVHFLGNFRYVFVFLFFCSQISNLKCHLIQKNLKQKNNGEKGIPHGEGFQFVSCANYFWEAMSWLFFSLFINHWSCYLFFAVGLTVMTKWAKERHSNYLKTFGDKYPKNRKAIIPFLI